MRKYIFRKGEKVNLFTKKSTSSQLVSRSNSTLREYMF